jgi:uncharacterized protein (DUF2249 family)
MAEGTGRGGAITSDQTVARVLDEYPQLVEVLADFHPHFRQLRNRLLRRVMAPRVTVAEAARMAQVPPETLLAALRRAVGQPEAVAGDPAGPAAGETAGVAPGPAALPPALASARQVHLDVREDLRRGVEPFARVMAAVKGLGEGEVLVLRAPFEPVPLYDVLGRRGLGHWTVCHAPDDWSVWFARLPAGEAAVAPATAREEGGGGTLDVRGLEPPQPMVRVLERLDRLGPGQELLVVHDRRPVFLYPQLDDRGFAHDTREVAPGLVEIRIRRGPARDAGA